MHTNNNCQIPNPHGIYDFLIGYWKTGIIKAAIELEIFSGIAVGENSVQKLALSRGVNERGLRVLLDSLCGLRLLNKERESYVLTPEADQFLVKGKKSYLGGAVKAFVNVEDWEVMGRIEDAVKKGGPLKKGEQNPLFWQEVARGLIPLGISVGQALCDNLDLRLGSRKGLRVLDIACGLGVYGFSVLQRDCTATVTDFDLESVLPVAEEVAREMGVSERVTFQPGNIESPDFQENAFDLAIISHILQGYGPASIQAILGRIYRALAPGGRLVIHEFVPDEQRAEKSLPLLFAVYMLVVTPEGGTYTFSEFTQWLTDAGFKEITVHDLPTQTSLIIANK